VADRRTVLSIYPYLNALGLAYITLEFPLRHLFLNLMAGYFCLYWMLGCQYAQQSPLCWKMDFWREYYDLCPEESYMGLLVEGMSIFRRACTGTRQLLGTKLSKVLYFQPTLMAQTQCLLRPQYRHRTRIEAIEWSESWPGNLSNSQLFSLGRHSCLFCRFVRFYRCRSSISGNNEWIWKVWAALNQGELGIS